MRRDSCVSKTEQPFATLRDQSLTHRLIREGEGSAWRV